MLIREAFEMVEGEYVDGAMRLREVDRDLRRRFNVTERAIDAAVKAGPTETEFRAALTAHVGVIRECIERRRAQLEAAADSSHATNPELKAWCSVERGR